MPAGAATGWSAVVFHTKNLAGNLSLLRVQRGRGEGQCHYPAADRDHRVEQRDGRPQRGELRQSFCHQQA